MKPDINVTPLIDILLVLLIIFMVISPIKPAQFETKIPSDQQVDGDPNPEMLIVKIHSDETLTLNTENSLGTIDEPAKLTERLKQVFSERLENRVVDENKTQNDNLPMSDRIQKTVFIKAPKSIAYGNVVKVIDELKNVGASPISLQIDDLEY